ncbi:MAG: hypothetical protein GC179_08275 [Anaerolineaceae bacterium]|nr:hypothetical protein [Anaerolineaceae bacterium]
MLKVFDLRRFKTQWASAMLVGIASLIVFMVLGHTPSMRALGMAACVTAVTLILQRFGTMLAVIGGFALAFSPAFWSQTGGEDTKLVVLVALTLLAALIVTGLFIWIGRVTERGLVAGVVVFAVLFWALVGTPRSLRVTTLLNTWLLYILIDVVMSTNPRPDSPRMPLPGQHHTLGLLVLVLIGVLNDPLFVLLAPALLVGLYLSKVQLPWWYWAIILVVVVIGIRGLTIQYVSDDWWLKSSALLQANGTQVPYFVRDGWREASRWLYLINLVRNQFTDVGILLAILGLARLSRWYPPLGTTTLVAYGSYALFGLIYFGKDSTVLLLPMIVIHVIWMTYAIYALGQWMQNSFVKRGQTAWLATGAFTLLPLLLLARIAGVL